MKRIRGRRLYVWISVGILVVICLAALAVRFHSSRHQVPDDDWLKLEKGTYEIHLQDYFENDQVELFVSGKSVKKWKTLSSDLSLGFADSVTFTPERYWMPVKLVVNGKTILDCSFIPGDCLMIGIGLDDKGRAVVATSRETVFYYD